MRQLFILFSLCFSLSLTAQEKITLLFVGDLMQHQAQIEAARLGTSYDYSSLFASVLKALGANLLRILIYKVENGIFYSYLYMKTEETILRIDARTSDAIALALRMNAPIFIYDDILETECLKTEHSTIANENEDTDKEAASPKKTLEQLKAALQNAIDKEDYERAAQLRDIINQQKKQ